MDDSQIKGRIMKHIVLNNIFDRVITYFNNSKILKYNELKKFFIEKDEKLNYKFLEYYEIFLIIHDNEDLDCIKTFNPEIMWKHRKYKNVYPFHDDYLKESILNLFDNQRLLININIESLMDYIKNKDILSLEYFANIDDLNSQYSDKSAFIKFSDLVKYKQEKLNSIAKSKTKKVKNTKKIRKVKI